jgi:threonine aldolase
MTRVLDFRSDTVTRPTAGMRAAMASAEVGDDVLGDDPTVRRLQQRVAEMLGKDAALFVPSGTMANLIALRVQGRPGDEIICEAQSHIFNYEQAGYAQFCGLAVRPVQGECGVMRAEQLADLIRPADAHFPRTRLVCLENTHNRGAGRVLPYDTVAAVTGWARQHGLRTHLDGARLWNAVAATGIALSQWAQHFDTVSVCFSKGLGAPAGSALCGSAEVIGEAIRHRKALGGAMRQSGVLAAAAIYALDHHRDRLADDHTNASRLAEGVRRIDGLRLTTQSIDSNMVIFQVDRTVGTATELVSAMAAEGLLMLATAAQNIRAVTHLDVTGDDVDLALRILANAMRRKA